MKKSIRIILPIVLALAIIICTGWYLFVYDRAFTRDVLLHAARYFESTGNHTVSTWFYNNAYLQAGDSDAVAIELAEQYKQSGNYTKAEYTLSHAISDGGGVDVYIALSKTYVEQDKLLDAVNMLDNITNKAVKEQLDAMRPAVPISTPDPLSTGAYYTQYITVTISADSGTLYVSSDGEFPSVVEDVYKNGITLKDGKNIIYAIAVADNGLVSPTAVFGFTVGGVIERVQFADATLETTFRELLDIDAETPVYTNDLWTIKEFSIPENVTSFEDLRHLAFLEKLEIHSGASIQLSFLSNLSNLKELSITDTSLGAQELSIIGALPNLTKLSIRGCGLSTTEGLEKATGLTHLDLSNNAVRDILPLSNLQKLQEVNLSHNALNDLSALSTLTSITSLDVSYNNLETLSPITVLSGLKKLTAGNNAVKEVTSFQNFTILEELDLSNNTITDVSPLSSCVALRKLILSSNTIKDITSFSKLTKLEDFNFSNNKVTSLPKWSTDCALVNIDGSYNQLDTLVPLQGLKKLNNVYMDYNKGITSVKALASCPVLIQVNVYGTGVRQVSDLTSQSVVVNYDPTK